MEAGDGPLEARNVRISEAGLCSAVGHALKDNLERVTNRLKKRGHVGLL